MKNLSFIIALAIGIGLLLSCSSSRDKDLRKENEKLRKELKSLEEELKDLQEKEISIETDSGKVTIKEKAAKDEKITENLRGEAFLKKFSYYKYYRISGDAVFVSGIKDGKTENYIYSEYTSSEDNTKTKYEFVPTTMDISEAIKLSDDYDSPWEGLKRNIEKKIIIEED